MASDGRSQLKRNAYRNRDVVKRCFDRLKEYRRIATHYDKMARSYLGIVKLGVSDYFTHRLCNNGLLLSKLESIQY